jgi:hypothetical protein
MNQIVERMIKESGEMWEAARDRTYPGNAVLIRLDTPTVYELTLPKNEHHPFWRVNERPLEPDEYTAYRLAWVEGNLHGIGDMIDMRDMRDMRDGIFYRTRAHVYNGRAAHRWNDSMEQVRVTIKEILPL